MYKPRPNSEIDLSGIAGGTPALCTAIISQAVYDYQYLESNNKDTAITRTGIISKAEIENFFKSEWGEFILSQVGEYYDPIFILDKLKNN